MRVQGFEWDAVYRGVWGCVWDTVHRGVWGCRVLYGALYRGCEDVGL